jgi:cobalt-zinc-cadmium efflux system outer membrane protein
MVLRLFIACVCIGATYETEAWGEDAKVPSYTLQEIIDLTLTHNPSIELGKGFIDEKTGEDVTAQSYPNPSFSVQSGYGKVRDPRGTSLIERYFTLSQPLEWPGTRAARQQAAEAGVRSAHASFDETLVNVKASVTRTFYELLLADTLADLASRLLNTVTDLEEAVKRRVESGEAAPFELVKVNVEALQAQKQVSQTKGNVRMMKAALNQLTAGNLVEAFAIQGDFTTVQGDVNEQRLTEDAFHYHPEVRKFQQLIEVANAQYHQEQQARVPNLTISGAYQRDAGHEGFIGGLSLPLPLWNQRQGEIAKALGIRRQAEASLRQAQISLRKGITEQVQVSRTASVQIHTFEQGLLKQAKEAVRIAKTSFKFGEASLLDVLDAQRVLWQTFQGYAHARFDLAIALTELERLVGKELS